MIFDDGGNVKAFFRRGQVKNIDGFKILFDSFKRLNFIVLSVPDVSFFWFQLIKMNSLDYTFTN